RLLSARDLDRQPGPSPFRIANVEPTCVQAAVAQQAHGLVRIDAVGTATVGDDLAPLGQLCRQLIEVRKRGRTSAGDMARGELALGTHVEQHDVAPEKTLLELLR